MNKCEGQFCSECLFALDYRHRKGCPREGEKFAPVSEVDALKAQIAELRARLDQKTDTHAND